MVMKTVMCVRARRSFNVVLWSNGLIQKHWHSTRAVERLKSEQESKDDSFGQSRKRPSWHLSLSDRAGAWDYSFRLRTRSQWNKGENGEHKTGMPREPILPA